VLQTVLARIVQAEGLSSDAEHPTLAVKRQMA
jgi:hypothetical protein